MPEGSRGIRTNECLAGILSFGSLEDLDLGTSSLDELDLGACCLDELDLVNSSMRRFGLGFDSDPRSKLILTVPSKHCWI
jgi:hypothetical protein